MTIPVLFEKFMRSECSPSEVDELMDWLADPSNGEQAKDVLSAAMNEHTIRTSDPLLKARLAKRLQQIIETDQGKEEETPVRKLNWKRWAVAASVIGLLFVAGILLIQNSKTSITPPVAKAGQEVEAPKGTKAMITLSNGNRVLLDSIMSGTLSQGKQVRVVKREDGTIEYHSETAASAAIEYNTLFNPRGSNVATLTLADGSKVWLNSESSIRYYTSVGNEPRRVEITGEAYFEVEKDATRKFIVTANNTTTEVLGTHFNVNSYPGEATLKVTLLEGSVKVSNAAAYKILSPGQQAAVAAGITVSNNIDVEEVMAWKNGLFKFSNASLQEVMKQLERWYDVEVKYEGTIPNLSFGGKMQRELNLSEVLEGLKKSEVHFRIDNKTIIVTR